MSTPRTRPESPAEAAPSRNAITAVLEPKHPEAAGTRSDAELRRAIDSTASRLLGLALARGVEERDPDEE